jgi:hypothetical protein
MHHRQPDGKIERSAAAVSNFIIRQKGHSSVVADNIWEVRLGAGSMLLGALAGFVVGALLGLRAGRSAASGGLRFLRTGL